MNATLKNGEKVDKGLKKLRWHCQSTFSRVLQTSVLHFLFASSFVALKERRKEMQKTKNRQYLSYSARTIKPIQYAIIYV